MQVPAPQAALLAQARATRSGSARADSENSGLPGFPRTPALSTKMERQTRERRAQSGAEAAHYPHFTTPPHRGQLPPKDVSHRVRDSSDHALRCHQPPNLSTTGLKKKNNKKTCSVWSRGNPQALRSHPKSLSCLEWALRGSLNLPFHLSNLWRRQAAGPLSPCDGAVTQLSRRVQESTADHTFHRPQGAGEKTRSFTKGERPGSDRL